MKPVPRRSYHCRNLVSNPPLSSLADATARSILGGRHAGCFKAANPWGATTDEVKSKMYYGLYTSAAGAHSQNQRVEVISNNLANVDTVGFKRELALLESRDSEAIERGQAQRGDGSRDNLGGGVEQKTTATDFGQGTLRQTGIDSDFALERPNMFFAVQRGKEQLLTRAGNFRVANDGRLVTPEGDAVLGSDGGPIQLDPALPWAAMAGGRIAQAGEVKELALRRPQNPRDLQKAGQNYFSAPAGKVQPAAEDERQVRNGYIEGSGVNPLREMVEMIAASRGYETNVRMIQNHDGMTGSLVSRLLKA